MLVKSGRLTNVCSVSSRNHVYIVEVRARSMAFFEPFDQDNRDHFFPENVQNYETNVCKSNTGLKPSHSTQNYINDITIHLPIFSLTDFCSAPQHFSTENM